MVSFPCVAVDHHLHLSLRLRSHLHLSLSLFYVSRDPVYPVLFQPPFPSFPLHRDAAMTMVMVVCLLTLLPSVGPDGFTSYSYVWEVFLSHALYHVPRHAWPHSHAQDGRGVGRVTQSCVSGRRFRFRPSDWPCLYHYRFRAEIEICYLHLGRHYCSAAALGVMHDPARCCVAASSHRRIVASLR